MDKFIKIVIKSMKGSMLPKKVEKDELTKDIYESLDRLDYISINMDKKNMRNDISILNRDFNKYKKEAESKLETIPM